MTPATAPPSSSSSSPSRLKRAVVVTLAASIAAICAAVYAFDPSDASSSAHKFFPRCPFHLVTGLNCPGCGSTRALHALMHGDVGAAFAFNAVFVVALPFIVVWIVVEALALFGRARSIAIQPKVAYAMVAALLAWGVIRNVIHA